MHTNIWCCLKWLKNNTIVWNVESHIHFRHCGVFEQYKNAHTCANARAISKVPTVSIFAAMTGTPVYVSLELRKLYVRTRLTYNLHACVACVHVDKVYKIVCWVICTRVRSENKEIKDSTIAITDIERRSHTGRERKRTQQMHTNTHFKQKDNKFNTIGSNWLGAFFFSSHTVRSRKDLTHLMILKDKAHDTEYTWVIYICCILPLNDCEESIASDGRGHP